MCSTGGWQSFFNLKTDLKVGETCSDVRYKVWHKTEILMCMRSWGSYNFFTNFILKLKNFIFFDIFNILKITVFCSKSITSICMNFYPNWTLVSLFKISWLIFFIVVKKITFCKRLYHLKELGKYFLKIQYFHPQSPKCSKQSPKFVFQVPMAFVKHQKNIFAYNL